MRQRRPTHRAEKVRIRVEVHPEYIEPLVPADTQHHVLSTLKALAARLWKREKAIAMNGAHAKVSHPIRDALITEGE